MAREQRTGKWLRVHVQMDGSESAVEGDEGVESGGEEGAEVGRARLTDMVVN